MCICAGFTSDALGLTDLLCALAACLYAPLPELLLADAAFEGSPMQQELTIRSEASSNECDFIWVSGNGCPYFLSASDELHNSIIAGGIFDGFMF